MNIKIHKDFQYKDQPLNEIGVDKPFTRQGNDSSFFIVSYTRASLFDPELNEKEVILMEFCENGSTRLRRIEGSHSWFIRFVEVNVTAYDHAF